MSEQVTGSEPFDFKTADLEQVEWPAVVAHQPLVAEIATKYLDKGLALEDLIRAGTSGIELAVSLDACPSGSDPDHYIRYWIRRGIIGALVADRVVNDFTGNFEQQFDRRPNLAEIRGFGVEESDRLGWEMAAYVQVVNDFVDSFFQDLGYMPTLAEAEAFGLARRKQLKHKLAAYVSETLLADPAETPGVVEAEGPLYIPASWLANLRETERQVLVLRYGLDGSGVKETRTVGSQLRLKTRRVGEILAEALTRLAEDNGIASQNLRVYPHLFDGLRDFDEKVLAMRLGFLGHPPMETRDIAAELGFSDESIRSAEWRAICHTKKNAEYNLKPATVTGWGVVTSDDGTA